MSEKHICPVCGFDGLKESPYGKGGEPSYEVCPCCGFEFGFNRDENYRLFRQKWIENGANWFIADKKPKRWDLRRQLENIDDMEID
jgi:hypothetical protein